MASGSEFPRLSRRSFFKALIALGVVSSFPEARALERHPAPKAPLREDRYFAIWQLPGLRPRLAMFVGEIPADAEVIVFKQMRILRFRRYPDKLHYYGSVKGTWTQPR